MDNTHLKHVLAVNNINEDNVRETFFANQCSVKHSLASSKSGDFMLDGKYTFEVGGRNKSFAQIKDLSNSFVAMDNIETGSGNKIPLWLFGFTY